MRVEHRPARLQCATRSDLATTPMRIRHRPLALPPDLKVDPSMPSPQGRWRPADAPIRLVRALPVLGA